MASRLAAFGVIRRAVGPTADDRTDATLLNEFFTRHDQPAFAALVSRHQRTVWLACSRVLTDRADVEDAFQATFLILARYGRQLGDRGEIGGWLYRVAERVARRLRAMTTQRRKRERKAVRATEMTPQPAESTDLFAVVSEELARLPDRYRSVILACDLDGLSRSAAAKRLGCSEGTLSARLHRGRKLLAGRLQARGVTAPLIGLGALLACPTQASAGLVTATAELAGVVAESGLTHRAVSAVVATLVTHTTREMAMKIVTKALAVVGLLVLAVTGFGVRQPGGGAVSAAPVNVKKEAKPDLPDATLQFLRNRKVLKELGCTAEQRVSISDHFDDQFEAAANRPPMLPPPAPGQKRDPVADRQMIEAKVKELMQADAADTKALAEKVLTAAQLTRLAQLDLQIRGVEALTDAKVSETLGLTDEQKKAAKDALVAAHRTTPAEPFGGLPVGPEGVRYIHLDPQQRKMAWEKATDGLSQGQLKAWEKLAGEPAKTLDPYTIGGRGGSTNSGVQFRGR